MPISPTSPGTAAASLPEPTAPPAGRRWPGVGWTWPLLAVLLASWGWLVVASLDMYGAMDGAAAWMMRARWDAHYAALIALMWVVMMAAMMLPSAWPVLRIHQAVVLRGGRGQAGRRTLAFALGYLVAWGGFSLVATGLQWGLSAARLLDAMMTSSSTALAGGLLLLAGAWQWTPWKAACLSQCRSPLAFVQQHWRPGARGAFAMGLRHGGWCVGCCWAAMLLLFVGGVMSLAWIIGIALFVLLEKLAAPGPLVGRALGALCVVTGLVLLLG